MKPYLFPKAMNAIIAFVATAYGLSIMLSLVIGLTGGHESTLIGLSYLSMFLPTISLLIVILTMNEPLRIRWDHFPLRYLPVALFLIPGVLHAVMIPLMAAIQGRLQWQDWLTPGPDGLYHTPASRGWGALTIQGLVAHIVLNALVGLAVVSFLAFFEEVGWRAWAASATRQSHRCPTCSCRHSGHLGTLACSVRALWHSAH